MIFTVALTILCSNWRRDHDMPARNIALISCTMKQICISFKKGNTWADPPDACSFVAQNWKFKLKLRSSRFSTRTEQLLVLNWLFVIDSWYFALVITIIQLTITNLRPVYCQILREYLWALWRLRRLEWYDWISGCKNIASSGWQFRGFPTQFRVSPFTRDAHSGKFVTIVILLDEDSHKFIVILPQYQAAHILARTQPARLGITITTCNSITKFN